MKIFNLQVKENNQTVQVHFDFIFQESDDGYSGLLKDIDYINFPRLTVDLHSKYGHHATAAIPEIKEHSDRFDFYDADMKKFNQASRIYQVPTKLPAAVYLIQNLARFLNETSLKNTHILINERSIQNDLQTVSLKRSELGFAPLPMMAMFYPKEIKRASKEVVSIQKTKLPIKEYFSSAVQTQETLVAHLLREIVNHYMKSNLDNDVTKYMRLYFQGVQANASQQESEYATQNILLTTFSQELLKADRGNDLEIALEALRAQAIQNLLRPCIGQRALDQKKYNWDYTECQFLKHAKFSLGQDGLMRITNVEDNLAYQRFYTKGRTEADSLEAELLFLGKIIGLEFAEHSQFDKEIVFTKECTQRLMAKNFHLMSVDAFKKSLPNQNPFSFFRNPELNKQSAALSANDASQNEHSSSSSMFQDVYGENGEEYSIFAPGK